MDQGDILGELVEGAVKLILMPFRWLFRSLFGRGVGLIRRIIAWGIVAVFVIAVLRAQ